MLDLQSNTGLANLSLGSGSRHGQGYVARALGLKSHRNSYVSTRLVTDVHLHASSAWKGQSLPLWRRINGDYGSYYDTSDSAYNFGYELRLEGEGAGIGAAQSCAQTHSR